MDYNAGKQDPFQPPQHQATQYLDQQGQYPVQQQYPQGQHVQHTGYQQPHTPGPLTHQNTMASTHNPPPMNPVPTTAHIQPDPLPKALTQPQVAVVTAQQVSQMYPGASVHYVPRLSAPDEFHYGLCGWFGDFFRCRNMSTCKSLDISLACVVK